MPESRVETQVRILLEQQTVALFHLLWPEIGKVSELTVLGFDFGAGDAPFHNVAFKTSLMLPELARTAEALLERWRTGKAGPPERGVVLPPPEALRAAGDVARAAMPEGWAVLIGRGHTSSYVANGDREGVAALIRDELLPHWKGAK